MARHRSYSIEFKRQVAQEFLGGESLNGLARRHDVSRNLIRVWIAKYEVPAIASGPAQLAPSTTSSRPPTFCSSTRRRSQRWNGSSDARHWRSSS